MQDGSLLKLTVAKWFTPKGKNIDDEWITPDIEISYIPEDYENLYDRQLEEAKKILQIFVDKGTIGLAIEEYEKQDSE
jgi:carboxyl-terminal processing protease